MSAILWLTWKDSSHPGAGGAEVICRELSTRLVSDGHKVTILTCGYDGATARERMGGVEIIRVGRSRCVHPFQALGYFLRHLRGKFDVLVEEVNGSAPYFSVFFEPRARKFLLYHQLGRKNWLYEMPLPFGHAGYWMLSPFASRLASLARTPVITVSESTRRELAGHGFDPRRTRIISEGIQLAPMADLRAERKCRRLTLLSLGAMRSMKRTLDQVWAFELAKQRLPKLRLRLAGSATGVYGRRVLEYIRRSPYAADIEYLGRVSSEDKLALMRRSHLILQTAIEEGWGLTITEAASQGTPAVAYDVAGLCDSIRHGQTGLITPEKPMALSEGIVDVLADRAYYARMRRAAWEWSKEITFDRSYRDFVNILEVS